MTEVISIRYKSCGKNYYFSPDGLQIKAGDMVVVETAKGLELAECTRGNRMVEDTAVVQPLRPVVRIATEQDLKNAEENKKRESEALAICRERVEAHGLDMKLVDAEISFDGSKTLFFFTSEGRVDFRELVKDLAGVFHNRIELRQIGVRDEAKMIGGIGICGRPYCCSVFLDDFAPVSTKMAKVQNLSLNPTKISGSCGRLMCCLRYEEDSYEELLKEVPKNGAFVETPDGYGIVTGVALLRQNIKVHLDSDTNDAEHVYPNAAVAVIPGGRPKDGEPYPKVLNYKPEEVEKVLEPVEKDIWSSPSLFGEMPDEHSGDAYSEENTAESESKRQSGRHSGKGSRTNGKRDTKPADARASTPVKDASPKDRDSSANTAPAEGNASEKREKRSNDKYGRRRHGKGQHNGEKAKDSERSSAVAGNAPSDGNGSLQSRSGGQAHNNAKVNGKNRHSEAKPQGNASAPNKTQENSTEPPKADSTRENRSSRSGHRHSHHGERRPNDGNAPKQEKKEPKPQAKPQEAAGEAAGGSGTPSARKPHKNNHHRYYGNKKKTGGNAGEAKQ